MAELISTMAQVQLTNGCKVSWEAIDPDTGAPVDGVIIRDAVLYGYDLTDTPPPATVDQTPLFVPLPNESLGS